MVKSKLPVDEPKVLRKQVKDDELNKDTKKKDGEPGEIISDQQREKLLKKIN